LMEWGEVAEELSDKFKAEVLAIDYPGYGKSEGPVPSTEKELLECADAAFQELISDKNSKLPVVLYGRSLGSAVASYLASQHEVNGLVLETPYTSIKAMAGVVLPIVPSFFVRYELDNEKNIKDLKIPILILHGTADPVVPYSQALELSKINSHITFITIEGGTHNSLSESPLYWDAVSKFLKAREQSL
ncbi:MAG: alpha/beta hydrolase, partial [Pseudobdellovibrio sp.]